MSTYTYREVLNEVLNQVQHLTPDEQLQLLEDVIASIRQRTSTQSQTEPRLYNAMEFRGFAKEIWKGVDVEKYIEEERNSWDG
jgi:hypothetical protein